MRKNWKKTANPFFSVNTLTGSPIVKNNIASCVVNLDKFLYFLNRIKFWVLGLSEDAKLAFLQEKIKQAKSNVRAGSSGIVSACVIIAAGIVASFWVGFIYLIAMVLLGAFFFVYGIYVAVHYSNQYDNLMKELEKMAIPTYTCPNCKKELPKGNFAFCPFCSASLKP